MTLIDRPLLPPYYINASVGASFLACVQEISYLRQQRSSGDHLVTRSEGVVTGGG